MTRRSSEDPGLTPLRAVALLRTVSKAYGTESLHSKNNALDDVADALMAHIKRGLRRPKRKR